MIELNNVAQEILEYVIEYKECDDIRCSHCPMSMFDNEKKSCKQIAKELKKMLDDQK